MNKVLGIVSEYNPFHNGHLLHLAQSKKLTKSNYSVCIMTGNFSQRGDTSLVDKWTKAEMAIKNGIDLVIELPTIYSISSAENFADGAIKILENLGIINYLSFGSEIGDINILDEISEVLYQEPKEFTDLLAMELDRGISFPKARENALKLFLNNTRRYSNVLSNPNNILGIEYLKALKKYNSNIIPITIKRDTVEYNSLKPSSDGIASATAIRNLIQRKRKFHRTVPFETYEILEDRIKYGKIVPGLYKFEKEIIYLLRKMSLEEIAKIPDVSEGLENKIQLAAYNCNNLDDLILSIKSKRYTETRIRRILLYVLLEINKKDMDISKKVIPYIRVLGFNSAGKQLLSNIAEANPRLNIIVSVKRFMETNPDKNLLSMLEKDIFATNVYTLGFEYESKANLDYTKKVIEIKS